MVVDILGYPITVIESDECRDASAWGLWDPANALISVRPGIAIPRMLGDTLLHEVIHAISTLALTGDDRLEENQVSVLSTALVDVLNRNPVLSRRILHTHKWTPPRKRR